MELLIHIDFPDQINEGDNVRFIPNENLIRLNEEEMN
jgi:hypothetical protein